MESIFDSPVTTNGTCKTFHTKTQRTDEVTQLASLFASLLTHANGNPNSAEFLPIRETKKCSWSFELIVRQVIDTTMSFDDLVVLACRHIRKAILHLSLIHI